MKGLVSMLTAGMLIAGVVVIIIAMNYPNNRPSPDSDINQIKENANESVLTGIVPDSSKLQEQSAKQEELQIDNQPTLTALSTEDYVKSLEDPTLGVYKATITDVNILILAVDAYPGANFDVFAQSYLEDALNHGVKVKGCFIVDVKNCQFQKGAVIGKRIGKAFAK